MREERRCVEEAVTKVQGRRDYWGGPSSGFWHGAASRDGDRFEAWSRGGTGRRCRRRSEVMA